MKYIIGGGVAGLITAYYSDHKIIDKNPMGQLNLRFLPGVRVIKVDDDAKGFIESVNKFKKFYNELQVHEVQIGYEDELGNKVALSEQFKQKYSLITRGKKEYESTFLSSGESTLSVFTADNLDPNIFYGKLFATVRDILDSREQIMYEKVVSINTENKSILTEAFDNATWIDYEHLISTIRGDILEKLMHDFNDRYLHDYTLFNKHFYKCDYIDWNERLMNTNSYNYSISGIFTRKTFVNDYEPYIVFETTKPLKQIQGTDDYIIGHKVLDKYENVPLQLKQSLNLTSFRGIELVGRFAQWNHSIKSNELIQRRRFLSE